MLSSKKALRLQGDGLSYHHGSLNLPKDEVLVWCRHGRQGGHTLQAP